MSFTVFKICSKCQRPKVRSCRFFYRTSCNADGLAGHCKDCEKLRRAMYYKKNRKREIDCAKRWQADNPEAKRQADCRYNRRHSAKHVARVRAWCQQNPEKARILARKRDATRRARVLDAFVEHVDPILVYERSGGYCGICGKEVSMENFHVDHIIPLACGGTHEYANTQAAHPRCNKIKGKRLVLVSDD